jgi:1,4-dihydroxy-2-naphthoyl-CoA hydrolase
LRLGIREEEQRSMTQEHATSAAAAADKKTNLPAHLGVEIQEVGRGFAKGRVIIQPHHMAPQGFLHAASIIGLLDSACGYGCLASLPEGASGFTTIELKANYLGTARSGSVACEARMAHSGRTTQVWDTEAIHVETGKVIALFRCTQMILYPTPLAQ